MSLQAWPARNTDAPALLRWRNDSTTRAMSLQTGIVSEQEHMAWLAAVLKDPTVRLMIVGDVDEVVGTYRLDYVGTNDVEISLTVAPEHRGQGYASRIIDLAVNHACVLCADRVSAVVLESNTLSIRAFERCGFVLDAVHDGKRFYVKDLTGSGTGQDTETRGTAPSGSPVRGGSTPSGSTTLSVQPEPHTFKRRSTGSRRRAGDSRASRRRTPRTR